MENKQTRPSRLEKIGVYVAVLTLVFMIWQGWRDISKEISDVRVKIQSIETKSDRAFSEDMNFQRRISFLEGAIER